MEKKSKGKTIVIVILVLAVLGLGGYIVYDKVLNIVTIVQSRNNHAFEVIAIEKDGTQHIIDTFE